MSRVFNESNLKPPVCQACKKVFANASFDVVDGGFICKDCMQVNYAGYKTCPGDYCNANKIRPDADLCETCELMSS